MALEKLVSAVCVRPGLLGSLANWALTLPRIIWLTKGGMAFSQRDIYSLYFSLGYYSAQAVNFVLQAFFGETRPNLACVEPDEFGFPSFEAQISFMFVGFIVGHYLLWDERIRSSSVFYLLVLALFIPWSLAFNGMNSVAQLGAGGLIGFIDGSARVYFYKYWLLPYVPILLEFRILRALSFKQYYFEELYQDRRRRRTLDGPGPRARRESWKFRGNSPLSV
jgi:hypothetical protein